MHDDAWDNAEIDYLSDMLKRNVSSAVKAYAHKRQAVLRARMQA